VKKQDKKDPIFATFGKFWTLEKFKAMTAVYLIGLWLQLLYALISHDIVSPPDWFAAIAFGLLPLGLVIAIVSYRIRLSKGIYLGLLDPLSWLVVMPINVYFRTIMNNQINFILWFFPIAVLSTIFYWQIFISPSELQITKITPLLKIFKK
jgi:hypothetical protein